MTDPVERGRKAYSPIFINGEIGFKSVRREKDDPSLITEDRGHEGNITVQYRRTRRRRWPAGCLQFGVAPKRTDVPNSSLWQTTSVREPSSSIRSVLFHPFLEHLRQARVNNQTPSCNYARDCSKRPTKRAYDPPPPIIPSTRVVFLLERGWSTRLVKNCSISSETNWRMLEESSF